MHYEEWGLGEGEIEFVDKRVKPYLHHKYWWPIASGRNMEMYYDFDPTSYGKKGQIIVYIHDQDFIYYITGSLKEVLSESYTYMDKWFEENPPEIKMELDKYNSKKDHKEELLENIFDILESQEVILEKIGIFMNMKGNKDIQKTYNLYYPNS